MEPEFFSQLITSLFSRVVITANVLAGAASVAATLANVFVASRRRQRVVKALEEARFERLLDAPDLVALGSYLDENLGSFSVRDYAADAAIARRLDRLLGRLESFVEVDSEDRVSSPIRLESTKVAAPPKTSDVATAWGDIERGEVWNGLARLRRLIEVTLRKYLERRGVQIEHLRSAGQMVRYASHNDLLDSAIARDLRYAIDVANRAIHGDDVSEDHAREAAFIVERTLRRLGE